jgi:hypothetical protein
MIRNSQKAEAYTTNIWIDTTDTSTVIADDVAQSGRQSVRPYCKDGSATSRTLAMLFALQQKLFNRDMVPLLSTRDIVELLSYYLPSRQTSEDELFRQMQQRHLSRIKSIAHHYKNENRSDPKMSAIV